MHLLASCLPQGVALPLGSKSTMLAGRSRLSPEGFRIYDELGLLQPVRVDRAWAYRCYEELKVATLKSVRGLTSGAARRTRPSPQLGQCAAQVAHGLTDALLVLNEGEAHMAVAAGPEAHAG
jgi:hypothetical protein